MAEYVRSRYRSARFATAVALLGVLASIGLGRGDDSLLEFDAAAAAAGKTITISGGITSKHVKNGSLLIKDFKASNLARGIDKHIFKATPLLAKTFVSAAELDTKTSDIFLKLDSAFRKHADTAFVGEGEFADQLVKYIDKATPILAKTLLPRDELDTKTSDIFIKLDSALRKHAETAFVGEGELDSKTSDIFLKLDSALRKHAETAFVGEGELDSKTSDIFIKLDSALRKHLDTAFVGEGELDAKWSEIFQKVDSALRKHLDKVFVKVEIPLDMVVPPVGATSSSFDLTTVAKAAAGEPQPCPKVLEVDSFVTVCAAPNQRDTASTVTVTNTFDTSLFMTYSPVANDPSVGKTIPPAGSLSVSMPDLALRTIQIAPVAGDDVPVATLTVSSHRVNGDGDLRISTQMMVARP